MSAMFASLQVPNYRRYAGGIVVSNTGLWMSRTAQAWLVLMVLTHHDARALGLVTGLQFLPILLFSTLGGAIADRFAKRAVLLWTQSILAVNALAIGLLVVSGHGQLWQVYLAALIEGTASAIDAPARQSFVSELVPKHRLSNAISLNAASFNAARLLGPGIAGLIIAALGTGPVFLINAASYLCIIAALIRLDRTALAPAPRPGSSGGIIEGFHYVRRRPDIALVLLVAFMMGTFGMNFQMTNVLMSTEVFAKGATEYGLLGSIMAVGSLTAALLAARRGQARFSHLVVGLAAFTVVTVLSAIAPNFWVFAALSVAVGLSTISVTVTANTLIQSRTDPEVRGRVMSLYMTFLLGSTPIGAPLIGWVAEAWGARWTLGIGAVMVGVACIVAAAQLLRTRSIQLRLDRHHPWLVLEDSPEDRSEPKAA